MKIYFAGSHSKHWDTHIVQLQGNRLYSQLNDFTGIKFWQEHNSNSNETLFVDSGAFTAKTKGVTIDIDSYVSKINEIGAKLQQFANLDIIPNNSTVEELKVSTNKGWENFLYIQKHCKYANKCCFVYHYNDPKTILQTSINYYKNNPQLKYYAIGGLVGHNTEESLSFVKNTCILLKKELPHVKIHVFGFTKLSQLPYIQCDSVDSTSWIMTAANGGIFTPWGVVVVSNAMQKDKNYILNKPAALQQKIISYIKTNNFTLENVQTDYKSRGQININYLKDWQLNYKYYKMRTKKSLI